MGNKTMVANSIFSMVSQLLDDEIQLEVFAASPENTAQMMVQTLSGEPIVKRYKNGDYLAKHYWALCLRLPLTNSDTRLTSLSSLSEAAKLVLQARPTMPKGFEFDKTQGGFAPILIETTEAFEIYQVTFTTEYKYRLER